MRPGLRAMWVGLVAISAPAAAASGQGQPPRTGILDDQSGPSSTPGGAGSIVAARTAVADFGGTVLGRPIEIVEAEHQNRPDAGAAIASRRFRWAPVFRLVTRP